MGVIADAFESVVDFAGDVAGDVFEAVGDVFEGAVDIVEDAASWIDDNVIQPILDDPITFIVSAAAYAYGIPGLSFAGPGTAAAAGIATTGSRLAQGDDFDDALKAGAFAGVTTGVTNSLSSAYTSGGQNWSPNLYSTADEIAANAARSSTGSSAAAGSIDNQVAKAGSVGTSAADDQILRDLADANALPRDVYPEFEPTAGLGDEAVPRYTEKNPLGTPEKDYLDVQHSQITPKDVDVYKPPVANAAAPDASPQSSSGPYKSSLGDIDAGMTSDYTDMSRRTDKPAPRGIVDDAPPGSPGYDVPVEERVVPTDRYVLDKDGNPVPAGSKSGWEGTKKLAGAVAETAGDWIWDGVKWVWDNPERALLYGAAGLSLLDALGKDNTPDDNSTITDDTKTKGDENFNANLTNLELQRELQALQGSGGKSAFDRSKNPYESDLYKYGETQGEHGFYGDTIYAPVNYSQPVTAAQGGSIGALNSQMPSYYRYGAMPMAMGGYASGGLRSLQQDGRSDHIPAMLSDGEFVVDAETVALLGNGSNEAGANRLEGMRQEVRKQKGKALSKGKFSSNAKSPLSYIKQRRG